MSRQIKFRAWNKNTGKFVYSNDCCLDIERCTLSAFFEFYSSEPIQQFTGLLDKRGNEIYEGDILKVEITDEVIPPNNGRKINARVIWDNFYARWVVEGKIENGLLEGEQYPFGPNENCFIDYYSTDRVNAEIIGNVFENPELLK